MRRLLLLVVVAGLAPLIGRLCTIEPGRLVSALHETQIGPVVLAMLLNGTLNAGARVARAVALYSALPRFDDRGGAVKLAPSLLVIHAANSLLPARAGDVLYPLLLRRHGYPFGAVVATQAMEARASLE